MNIEKLVLDLYLYDDEQEWFEFKENWFQPEVLGEYISALSNAAAFQKIKKVGKNVGDKKGLNARRQRIIIEMRDNPNITTSELHQILGISGTAVENNLTFLKENGYVERIGSKKTGYWKVLE